MAKNITVILGAIVTLFGLLLFASAYASNTLGVESSGWADVVAAIVGRLDGNYIPGLVLIIAGGGIMYFGSRDG